MDHLSGSGDASRIGKFFQLSLRKINHYLGAKLRAIAIFERDLTHNNVVSGL